MNIKRIVLPLALLSVLSPAVWSALAHDGEHHSPGGNGQPNDAPLAAAVDQPCVNGMAGTFPCNKVDLAALLPVADIDGTAAAGVTANDIWGWTDPLTDKEYALVGLSNGVAFVDVTNPTAPVYLGNLPRTATAADSLWRSVKVYRNHLYVVSEAAGHGMQVFDLARLRNVSSPPVAFTETAHYDNFSSAHTIAVNEETGFLYVAGSRPAANHTPNVDTCPGATDTRGGGLHMVDARNPAAPAFAGCVNEDGYTHETQCVIYRGPDAQYQGREVCFNANEDTLTIVDVTDKSAPHQLSRTTYAGRGYTHQGWLTGDHARFLLDDELDEQNFALPKNRTFVWDVSDLDAPSVQGIFQGSTPSIDHNQYVRSLHAFQSNYRSGLRVIDVRNASAASLSEVAFFDVYPVNDAAAFNGTWSNYPFFASGTVVVSGIEQGLFVLRPQVGMPVRIDYEPFFVRQHYRDFLGREPDEAGLAFWTQDIEKCMGDAVCREVKRINVSAAFFLSIEFQETGFYAIRVQRVAFGRRSNDPATRMTFDEVTNAQRQIGQGVVVGQPGYEQRIDNNKTFYASQVQNTLAFNNRFPQTNAAAYVDALYASAGVTPTPAERQAAISAFSLANSVETGRTAALRAVADSNSVRAAEFNSAFVLMEYHGYLRRNPDEEGYNFWLKKLNDFNGNYVEAEMVKAFITSIEYRQRFGQ
ncbi:MAG TPA: choice-of-anchor B family protein [Pyrinomonadaceae bacterium]|jgi:choice-of-anchor B domain-containing protein